MTTPTDHTRPDPLDDFGVGVFTFDGVSRDVYTIGATGPGILLLHEIPGISPACATLARRLVESGFRVCVPSLLGDPGARMTGRYALRSMARLCVSREFQAFALKSDRPVIRWLRALGADLHDRCGGPGIGAIGMCMTGGFALALAVDPHVLAPVLSQPSLPFVLSPWHAADIGVSDATAQVVADRCSTDDLRLLGLRFEGDQLAPRRRFDALRERFGSAFEEIELDEARWHRSREALPPHQRPSAPGTGPHAVLGGHYIDGPPTRAAVDRMVELFTQRLVPS